MWNSSSARVAALAIGLAIPLVAWVPAGAADANPCNPCAPGEANPCNPCGAKAGNPCNPCGAANPCNPCAPKETNPCGANPCNPCAPKETNPCGANPCNPCAPKETNPCGANPCNPCAPKKTNPCGANPCNPCNPCGAKGTNPCNPCGASGGVDPAKFTSPEGLRMGGDRERLIAEGEKLWNDTSLSTNGAACATCHVNYSQFLPSFAEPYPHEVTMVKSMSGVEQVDAAEMVQFCMLQPMQAEPLPWNSRELVALTAYVEHLQSGFEPNPCAMRSANPCNPCGANPCGSNPCNPCGAKTANPCGANPCGR